MTSKVAEAGLEPDATNHDSACTSSEPSTPPGAKSGAPSARIPTAAGPAIDAHLAEVITRWPALPDSTRAAIVALVTNRQPEKSPGGVVACRLAGGVECGAKGLTGR